MFLDSPEARCVEEDLLRNVSIAELLFRKLVILTQLIALSNETCTTGRLYLARRTTIRAGQELMDLHCDCRLPMTLCTWHVCHARGIDRS